MLLGCNFSGAEQHKEQVRGRRAVDRDAGQPPQGNGEQSTG